MLPACFLNAPTDCRVGPLGLLAMTKEEAPVIPRPVRRLVVGIRFLWNWKGTGMYYVYILSNAMNTTIYTGVTNNLERRLWEHRSHVDRNSFTARYHVTKLVYFEMTTDVHSALEREKQIKSWSRKRKNDLIQKKNPEWRDLLPQGNVL